MISNHRISLVVLVCIITHNCISADRPNQELVVKTPSTAREPIITQQRSPLTPASDYHGASGSWMTHGMPSTPSVDGNSPIIPITNPTTAAAVEQSSTTATNKVTTTAPTVPFLQRLLSFLQKR